MCNCCCNFKFRKCLTNKETFVMQTNDFMMKCFFMENWIVFIELAKMLGVIVFFRISKFRNFLKRKLLILESLQLNIWPNHYRCKADMMRCLQKNENFENRPKKLSNFFKNRFFHVLKSIWPFFWPVFILIINLKTKHLNWLATTRVCQNFHSWWMYKRFFKKKQIQRCIMKASFQQKISMFK